MPVQFSPQYLALLNEFEGYYTIPYMCPAGKCTIGYGTNLEAHPRYIPYADIREKVQAGKLRGSGLVRILRDRGMTWDKGKAEEAMLEELAGTEEDHRTRCSAYRVLRDKGETVRAEALLDMAYNMGVGNPPRQGKRGSGLLGFYGTLPMIERGEYVKAAENLRNSAWYRQVGRRSRAVCAMLRNGTYPEKI